MKPLILDFLRRWRWLFVIALLLSVASSITGFPFVFAPAAVFTLLLDAQRGVFRAVRPLPVSRNDQAKAWWLVGVPLLPLLSVPVLAIGVLVSQQLNLPAAMGLRPPPRVIPAALPVDVEARDALIESPSPPATVAPSFAQERRFIGSLSDSNTKPAPWFSAGVQTWVALGYAGFCFFLMQWAPTSPAENLAENVQQGIFGALWGISMPGVAFLLPCLPRNPDAIASWHWAVLAASPVFVALSYFSAADLLQRRMFITSVKERPPAPAEVGAGSGGLTGVPLFLATFAGRIVLFLVLIACVQVVVMRWMLGGKMPSNNPSLALQVVMMGLLMGAMVTEAIGIRGLRVLPLSTRRLAVLLSLISWAAAVSGAAFSAFWCGAGDPSLAPWLNFAGVSVAMCGWATLALAVVLHTSSSGRIFLLILFGMIPSACISFLQDYTVLFAAIGAIAGIAGFALLVRGLKKSAAFYRPRGFFGMTPGQPSAVR